MPTKLVVEWDRQCLRYVTADIPRRGPARNLQAGVLEFDEEESNSARPALALKQLVDANSKASVTVALGAGAVDMTELTLPPAADHEVPVFVMNLARQEFGFSNDEPALDYVARPSADEESQTVTAMLLRDDDHQQLQQTLDAAETTASRIILKPHTLATWLTKPRGLGMAVAVGSRTCDALIVSDGHPIALRSLRLPAKANPEGVARYCVSELRRTLMAAGDDLTAETHLDELVVLGAGSGATELATSLTTEFGVNASLASPFDDTDTSNIPDDPGAWAGLVGVLIKPESAVVDFRNPRRPPTPVSKVRVLTVAALLFVGLIGAGSYYVWSQFSEVDEVNQLREARLRELKKLVKESQSKRRLASVLTAWEKARFSWLDELRDLTERMPARSDMTVRRLTIAPGGRGSATVSFGGTATRADAVARMENALRDGHHSLRTPGLREQSRDGKAVWTFQTTMRVRPRSAEQYRSSASTENVAKTARSDAP